MAHLTIPKKISDHDQSLVQSIRYLAADKRVDDYSFSVFFYAIVERLDYTPKKC